MASKEEARAVKEQLLEEYGGSDYINGFGLATDIDDCDSWVVAIGLTRDIPSGTLPKERAGVKIITTQLGAVRVH